MAKKSPGAAAPTNYFGKEKAALKVLGLSLTGNESRAYKIYSFFFILLVNTSYPFLNVGDVFKNSFDVVADMLIYQFAVFVGLAKTAVVLRNRLTFISILKKLESPPFTPDYQRGGDAENTLIRRCVTITHIQTLAYWTCAVVSIASAVLYTLYRRIMSNDYRDWEFPYGPFTILNVTYSPNYEISWFYQSASVAVICCHFTTIDLLTASVLCHISYQFKVLQNNLKRLVENAYMDMTKKKIFVRLTTVVKISLLICFSSFMPHISPFYAIILIQHRRCQIDEHELENEGEVDRSTIPWKYLSKSLEQAVGYHSAIIAVADELENVFSNLLLAVFLGTLVMLCFIVYHTSLLSMDDVRMIRSIAEALSCCLQVLTMCFWGEQVVFESVQVGQAAYEANFIGTDLRFQKSLAFIMRRSQNPIRLTAGKFADICLTTFTWIMRTSYSAFMVLHNGKNQDA